MADKLNSTFFTPGIIPDDPAQLPQYLRNQQINLQGAIQSLNQGHYDKLYVAPAKPRDGDVAYADGTKWNPGYGAGLYQHNGTSWNLIGILASSQDWGFVYDVATNTLDYGSLI